MIADLKDNTSANQPASTNRLLIWQDTFPGEKDQPGRVRQQLARVLQTHPDLDEILLVVSELSTNAVLHTRSGHEGGAFSVQVATVGLQYLMVAVTDEGAATEPRLITPAPTETHFRGLQVVQSLSLHYGIDGDAEGRTVWALFAPLGSGAPRPVGPC